MKKLLLRIGIVMAGFIFTMGLNVDEAHAGVVAGLATEWTQIMNNVQLVLQYEQQIQQYATQLQQAQNASRAPGGGIQANYGDGSRDWQRQLQFQRHCQRSVCVERCCAVRKWPGLLDGQSGR